ncbi:MAG TPA: hypothetical protein VJM33_03510, partial [Microthrixaceae bacterium]|nr:hypothetical protein [Microthrixaceae bacterium]
MLFALWSAKGGVGVTTTAVGLASVLAADRSSQSRSRRARPDVLLVDLGGDLPASVGLPQPEHGLTDWLAVDADGAALRRVEVPVSASIA